MLTPGDWLRLHVHLRGNKNLGRTCVVSWCCQLVPTMSPHSEKLILLPPKKEKSGDFSCYETSAISEVKPHTSPCFSPPKAALPLPLPPCLAAS